MEEKYIEKIISPIKNKEANMVIGSRFVGNESEFKSTRLRQIGIRVLSFLLKILTKKKINDMTSGFRAVDKKIIDMDSKDSNYYYLDDSNLAELGLNNIQLDSNFIVDYKKNDIIYVKGIENADGNIIYKLSDMK